MKDVKLVQVLEDAGLSPYQAEAYVTLLELGNASAMDVADSCDVPDPRIYDVLRDLESKGYAETYQQDCLTARAHDPEVVLEDLRSRSSEYLDAAAEIEERWKKPAVTEHEVSIVKRFDTVLKRASTLVEEARLQVKFAGNVDHLCAMKSELADALERGVTIKISLWESDDGPAIPDDTELANLCSEARCRELPSSFVVIVDRENTCFAPNHRSVNEFGVLVSDRTYSFVFHWYFLTALWENCPTIYTGRRSELPRVYVDIRSFVRDAERLLNADATISVTIRGYETETAEETELTGTVRSVDYGGESSKTAQQLPTQQLSLSQLTGRVYVTVDSGTELVEVGGWGAFIEEIAAESITVTDIDY